MHSVTKLGATAHSVALAIVAFGGCLCAQSTLPASAPTAVTPSQLPSANPSIPHSQASLRWDGHLLQITATGERLQDVLAQMSIRAGVHMTGYAPEDRIYGDYGPAPLGEVLSELVSGLPVNMLFVDRSGTKPAELTFTTRNGAATPPNANSSQQFAQQQFSPQPANPQEPAIPPPSNANTGSGPGPIGPAGAPGTATPPADGSSNATSPNGVRTPQEIFEQLQRLRANAGAPKQ